MGIWDLEISTIQIVEWGYLDEGCVSLLDFCEHGNTILDYLKGNGFID